MADADYVPDESVDDHRKALMEFFRTFPFFKLLGIKVLDIEPGRSKLQVGYRTDLCQPAGILHGGVIATLVDTAIAHSILLTDRYMEAHARGAQIVTVDLRIKYLRPVPSGTITCVAHTPRVGRTITHSSAVVTDEADKEVATGDSIYMVVERQKLQKK